MRFRDFPIRRKLTLMILGTSGAVLLLTCSGFVGYEFFTYRRAAVRELTTLGSIIAAQSTGSVAFDNQRDATEILSALQAEPHITAAALYDQGGRLFARYPATASAGAFPAGPGEEGYVFSKGRLIGFAPLVQTKGSDRLGWLYLSSDMQAINDRLRLYGLIVLLVVAVAACVAYLLTRVLQRYLSRPILELADAAQAVSVRRDYSVRTAKLGNDELGLLTDAFNQMLAEIEEQNALLEKRVRERTAELEAANDELEAFCSSAAHDLRTPLRAITGFTEVLLDERAAHVTPDGRRYVGSIQTGSSQMSRLIEDLLAFSRVGRQDLARREVALGPICQSVLAEAGSDTVPRGIKIAVDTLPEVFADPALVRIVFVNLISNALKYSRGRDPAMVEIGTATPTDEGNSVVYVRDNGVGFDMRDADKLFGVFQRLHHAREFEGTGVGLATVRRIIERHGGRIWAKSAPGEGSTFCFTLPGKAQS
jgi:signal transduction histidine kinase